MDQPQLAEPFRDLLLRYRARSRLTQRQVAEAVGVHRRSVQEWENGSTYPSPERLEALIRVLLESNGLTQGHEEADASALWSAVQRQAPHVHAPFDRTWFVRLVGDSGSEVARPALAEPARQPDGGPRRDWGEAPDVSGFVGRSEEVETLSRWVRDERCRLAAVLGMGGIGKTTLVARVAEHVAPAFERVYWRTLRDAPPIRDWLSGAIDFLSDQELASPASESQGLTLLLDQLRAQRCLLVLDNTETLFEAGLGEGQYRPGMAGYGRLLRVVGEAGHQSCLILTSRERPPEVGMLAGDAVRTLSVGGLGVAEAQVLLAGKQLAGSPQEWAELTARVGGNGLALKIVSETVRDLFDGEIGGFLAEAESGNLFGIRRLLSEQLERCSPAELQVLRVLAVEREPVPLPTLLAASSRLRRGEALEALEALRRRSLVERAETPGAAIAFTLQSVVLEYVTERLVEEVSDEIARGRPLLLIEQPLIKAQTKDYVRQTQERLFGESILRRLEASNDAEELLLGLLEHWRRRPLPDQGFGPGNAVNLLRLLRGNLRGVDMSHLELRQVHLAQVDAQDASLVEAHLVEAVLADVFGVPLSVALTGDRVLFATGTSAGEVWLWRVADRTPLWATRGHTGGVWSLALPADGHLLASGGADGMVRLWETITGRPLATLQGHTGAVSGVALSADAHLLASGGADGTARLWETSTGRPLATLQGHTGAVWGVALSRCGHVLATAGADGTVRLWQTQTGQPVATLQGHTGAVSGVAMSADSQLLASGGADGTVRLWDSTTGALLATLRGHTGAVWRVALSGDGRLLLSGSEDGTLRLWETETGGPVATLQGHTGAVRGVALSADGRLLASGSFDGSVRLWEADTRRPVATLQGRIGAVWGVTVSANGLLLASASEDGTVRLWDTDTGAIRAILQGHTGAVRAVAYSADGRLLASGGFDGTLRLWDGATGQALATLQGHAATVRGVALCADGHLLASGSYDGTLRLWDTASGRQLSFVQGHSDGVGSVALSADGRLLASACFDGTVLVWDTGTGRPLATLAGDSATVRGVALSADGRLLASGGEDGILRLWDAGTGRQLATLEGHATTVRGVALSADGRLLASGAEDGTVRLWDTDELRQLAILPGHTATVRGVALSADGRLLASGSFDGTVRLWEVRRATCLRVLQPALRYEGLNITGLSGITAAQHAALLALGAVEHGGPTSGGANQDVGSGAADLGGRPRRG